MRRPEWPSACLVEAIKAADAAPPDRPTAPTTLKKSRRKQKRGLRIFLGVIAVLTVLIFGSVFGFRSYRKWQADRFVRRAETYLGWGDNKSATLTARNVLEFAPSNNGALRVMAEVSEREGVSSAIDWRQKVADNNPESVSDAVALAKTAMKFGSLPTAQKALERIGAKAGTSAQYHEALGQLAAAKKDPREAETHFIAALKLKPDDVTLQLELAVVQLRSNDSATKGEAARVLTRLLNDRGVRVAAAKNLIQNALEQRDSDVVHFAEVLLGFPEASFQDRLLCLQLFNRLQLPQFASALTDLQAEAAENPEKLAILLSWMSGNHLGIVALDWTKRLAPEMLMKRPVFVAVADCYISARDWTGLQEWCTKKEWPGLESLRHAYLALSSRSTGDSINSDLEWSKAVKLATTTDDLETLQRAAAKWDWKKESVDLLWTLANNSDKQRAALNTLYQYYGEQGDTASLYRVAAKLARIAPDDPLIQNNFAQLSLLLNADVDHARTLARRVYEERKTDANFASTYAFALFTQRLPDQAVKVMDSLNPEQLKRPEIAAYYGIMLASMGDRNKAQSYLELGKTARLLPEEKKLLDDAFGR